MKVLLNKHRQCMCGALLIYTDKDIKQYAGNRYIVCPHCSTRLYLEDNEIYTCDNCGKDFVLTDKHIGANGCLYTICPHCHSEEWIDPGIDLDETNICYPQHFFQYTNGKSIDDQTTTEWVRDCISHLDKESDYYLMSSGDTLCIVVKSDEESHEATVFVCKKYSECSVIIPAEKY